MAAEQTALLRQFIALCKSNPAILHSPEFTFYKEYLESLGATIPSEPNAPSPPPEEPEEEIPVEEEMEEALELDNTGVIERDNDEPLPMGNIDIEPNKEQMDKADSLSAAALAAFSSDQYEKALQLFTEAIVLTPGSSFLHVRRAATLVRLNKPVAAIRDCDKAIAINPDSAQAYKTRGRAHRFIGEWLEAHHDLAMACKLDYDYIANDWLKEVEPNAKKIMEFQRQKERSDEEKAIAKKRESIRKAKEARKKAQEEEDKRRQKQGGMPGGMGGMPGGMGGMPGGMEGLSDLLNSPELMDLFQDQETMQAYMEIMQNPSSINKHMSNQKVMKLLQMMQSKAGKMNDNSTTSVPKEPTPENIPNEPPRKAPEPDID